MTLDEAKRRITLRTVPGHLLEMDDSVGSVAFTEDQGLQVEPGAAVVSEGEKKHHTPKFVQHCVTAITEKPESLARVKREAPKGSDGSPFAICWAAYKKKTRSKAAKHSQGKHHTVKQYEGALKKLREETEELRSSRPSRNTIVFEAAPTGEPRGASRRGIRFSPED